MSDQEDVNNLNSPVLICGMHRSGTSLVAQLLNSCGLYLGTEDQLMQAHSEDNPAGYWEYLSAVHFADSILSKIGCSWDNPKNLFSDTWLMDLNVEEEKQKAIEIFKPLIDFGKPWGWKDPRATILLPFWKTVFPNLKIIICLRNPLEVAFSLSKRNGATHVDFENALILWRDYYEILNRTMQGTGYLVTHYETFFYDPDKELRRICDFSGLSPKKNDIGDIQNIIKSNLYRGVATEKLLKRFDKLPVGLLTLYEGLSAKAGSVHKTMLLDQNYEQSHADTAFEKLFSTSYTNLDQYHHNLRGAKEELLQKFNTQLTEREQTIQNLNTQLTEREQTIQNLNAQLAEKDQSIQTLNAQLAEKDQSLQSLNTQLAEKDQSIQSLNAQLAEKDQSIQLLNAQLVDKDQSIQSLNTQLAESRNEVLYYALSKSWRFTRPLRKIMNLFRGKKND